MQAEAQMYHRLKRWTGACKRSRNWFVRVVLSKFVVAPVMLLSYHLSQVRQGVLWRAPKGG